MDIVINKIKVYSMHSLSGFIKRLSLIAIVVIATAIVMPAIMYKESAKSAEELIIVLSSENITIIERTSEIITAKLNLPLDDEVIKNHVTLMLKSKSEDHVDARIKQIIRNYRLPISYQDQERFSNYIKEKRIYFLENSDKIVKYVDEYQRYLSEPLSGFYLRITGFPKRVVIKQEL